MTAVRELWRAGDLLIDAGKQELSRHGQPIELPPLSFRLLLELVRSAPDVISIDELMTRVWQGVVVGPDTVIQRVKLLRDALGDSPQEPVYILGMRGRGYRFLAPVEQVRVAPPLAEGGADDATGNRSGAPAAVAAGRASAAARTGPAWRRAGRLARAWRWQLLVLLLAGAGLAAVLSSAWRAPPADAYSIAVLPFANQSGDPGNAFFAAGLADEISRLLARVPGLRIVDADHPLADAVRALPAGELGTRLGVHWLLRGSVRESGERIRIGVELLQVEGAVRRWSEIYERDAGDVFALQDEVAAAVVGQLRLRLDGAMPQARPTDPAAYTLFLRAQYLTMRTSPSGLEEALQLYRQALAIAPDYAAAWEGMARTYQQQAGLRLRPASEAFALANEAATRAIAADPQFGLAYARLGAIELAKGGDLALAARHMVHGYALDPAHNLTNGNLAVLLRSIGRLDDALAYAEIADRIDPLNPRAMLSSAYTRIVTGRFEEAQARIDEALQLSPDFAGAYQLRAILLLQEQRAAEALDAAEREVLPPKRLVARALALHSLGRTADAAAALHELEALHAAGRMTAYALACVSAWRGEREQAFDWLERAVTRDDREYDVDFAQLLVDPLLRSLHGDPRWDALLARIGRSPAQLAAIRIDPPAGT